MRNLLYVLLTVVSILFTSCGPSSSTNNPQEPNVPQPQPQPQPEVTQKVVIGYLPLDDWEFESLFPSIEWKYLTHINASFARVKADGTLNIDPVRERIESVRETAHKHNVKILISLAKNSPRIYGCHQRSESQKGTDTAGDCIHQRIQAGWLRH